MPDKTELKVVHQTLLDQLTDQPWLALLTTLDVAGVADTQQFQKATGLNRDKTMRLLDDMHAIHPDLCPWLGHAVPRPGVRGHPPKVYRLGEMGAAILRLNDCPQARACGLKDDTPIAHALALLDLSLAAKQSGVAIQIDRELKYGNGRGLRPDGLITLPDGLLAFFEIEQAAAPDYLRRMKDSLQNRLDFFRNKEGQAAQPIVRMLINVPRGKTWTKTIGYWQQVIPIAFGRNFRKPPYRILALPLAEFLQNPDWSAQPDETRWIDLTSSAAEEAATTNAGLPALVVAAKVPNGLRSRSSYDDRLIIEALWQVFQETAHKPDRNLSRADPAFFELMRLIHAASHDEHLSPREQAGMPDASLYLLMRYLQMHPLLRTDIQKALKRGAIMTRWNPTMVTHRMQIVIDTFLEYHGWHVDGPLQARAAMTNWDDREPRVFSVEVSIGSSELLMSERDGVVPGRDELDRACSALAWVLYALFAYARHIGLETPVFW